MALLFALLMPETLQSWYSLVLPNTADGSVTGSHDATFFRVIATEFPVLLDVLCLRAVDPQQRQMIDELRSAIHFLGLCMKWARNQVLGSLTVCSPA